jgi:hypothetical protein
MVAVLAEGRGGSHGGLAVKKKRDVRREKKEERINGEEGEDKEVVRVGPTPMAAS